jgi:hypothetical protein
MRAGCDAAQAKPARNAVNPAPEFNGEASDQGTLGYLPYGPKKPFVSTITSVGLVANTFIDPLLVGTTAAFATT